MFLSLAFNNFSGDLPFKFWTDQPATLLLGDNNLSFELGWDTEYGLNAFSAVKVIVAISKKNFIW